MFETITNAHGLMCSNRAEFQSLYHYRPWAKNQGDGYIPYMRILWWDHSYSYDDSMYQSPTTHADQHEAYGAYSSSRDNLMGVLSYSLYH
mmetsp:Transcript_32399/g.66973  ORF Transcript_32399/g.66973 Transcript_32399/m.66973 type:complete len:90 (-) Transcript_32399:440-709(-)